MKYCSNIPFNQIFAFEIAEPELGKRPWILPNLQNSILNMYKMVPYTKLDEWPNSALGYTLQPACIASKQVW